jgi:hypothetical protein
LADNHNKSSIDEEKGIKYRGKKHILIKPKVEANEGINDNHQVQLLKQQIWTLQQQNQDSKKQHSKLQKKYQKLQRKHQKTCFFLKEII